MRHEVAKCGQSQSSHHRILHRVDQLVDAARLEPALEVDGSPVVHQLAVDLAREAPSTARHPLALAGRRVSNGERVALALRLIDGVLPAANPPEDEVAE